MIIISYNTEERLIDALKAIKDNPGNSYAIHFHLSLLKEHYRSEFQIKIATNILNDIFRDEAGNIFVANDGDLYVLYYGDDVNLVEKAVFQLRYLFVDDPLANHLDGMENKDFCTTYDLLRQWKILYKRCITRLGIHEQKSLPDKPRKTDGILTPIELDDIETELIDLDISFALRKQPVCAIKNGKTRSVFHEVYVNIGHFRRLLSTDCNVLSQKWLFKYLTELLDINVLNILLENPRQYLLKPISLNLNIKTILSPEFKDFHKNTGKFLKTGVIVEINVADLFADMNAFLAAKKRIHQYGYRICLDGLNNLSFVQLDREHLGFDLAKLQWNADMKGDLGTPENKHLATAIEKCGSNRMILCRCDDQHAIEYGHALGISLFQGRYPDRILDPDSMILN